MVNVACCEDPYAATSAPRETVVHNVVAQHMLRQFTDVVCESLTRSGSQHRGGCERRGYHEHEQRRYR
jgi:hypothetical protein